MSFKSGNPALQSKIFAKQKSATPVPAMTMQGTLNKATFLFFILFLTACLGWTASIMLPPIAYGGVFGGLLAAIITGLAIIFLPKYSAFLSIIYTIGEGFCLGVISYYFEAEYPGIVLQAVGGTLGTFAVMLLIYRAPWFKLSGKFRSVIVSCTLGIFLFYLVDLISVLAFHNESLISTGGLLGIIISLVVCAVAALNLFIDFQNISDGVKSSAPDYMEWYASWGLIVTIIWMYIEILRLLAKIRRSTSD